MTFKDPKLSAAPPEPGAGWGPKETKPVSLEHTTALSNPPVVRATIGDNGIQNLSNEKVQRTSTTAIAAEANALKGVPYERAVDPTTGQPLAPHELQENSLLYFKGGEVTVAQARAIGWLK